MEVINLYLTIIILHAIGLNFPIKEWVNESQPKPQICCVEETHLTFKNNYRLKMETKSKQVYLQFDKIEFKSKSVKRDKEGYYVMIKKSIQQENIIINMHVPNAGASV